MSKLPKALLEKMINTNIWNETCPVHHNRLRLVSVEFFNFSGKIEQDGKIIVLDVIADRIKQIFEDLLEIKFPISQIRTIDEFDGSDKLSMEENNSSGFNCRKIKNSNLFSIHSYGLAVDINPLNNPFVSWVNDKLYFEPSGASDYVERSKSFQGKVTDEVVEIFKKHQLNGWGGNWQSVKDWHHFEIPREDANKIISVGYKQGKKYLDSISSF